MSSAQDATTSLHVSNASTTAAPSSHATTTATQAPPPARVTAKRRRAAHADDDLNKRSCVSRVCVSSACIACRRRKSKCDGNTPACAACSQVYNTECIYDPNSDHRRKGVYKNEAENLKTKDTTLQTLIQAILNYSEDEVPDLIRQIRTCDSLDDVAERVLAKENGEVVDEDVAEPVKRDAMPRFEAKLYGKMGDLRVDGGAMRYIGGTSNLIHVNEQNEAHSDNEYEQQENAILSWTQVTDDVELVNHLLRMYFTWHYTYFTTLSKSLFYRDFALGRQPGENKRTTYCSAILVNAMLALGCHFTSHTGARSKSDDSATAGDHFFKEAKRLLMENDVLEKPRLTTVQALALMSVREAGCGREAKGWVYSGMSFRMSGDLGLHLDSEQLSDRPSSPGDEQDRDARRITFWGCFLFDKCWSNYLGRLPQLPRSMITTPKFEIFPQEDAADWTPYTDSGATDAQAQPARTRAVALEISKLCEISNDLMQNFYDPTTMDKMKGKQAELKLLSNVHTRLESWRRELPKELEPKEGGLASVLVMHMFFQLLFIHLFRPFLKYTQDTSPLPSTVSPRKLCTHAAASISKLLRLYKRSYGLRQICNIAVYIVHSACTIHLLNLPEKNAKRDIIHGVKHLEEIAESWLCARRSLGILSQVAHKWDVQLPYEAEVVLTRTDAKFGPFKREALSPSNNLDSKPATNVGILITQTSSPMTGMHAGRQQTLTHSVPLETSLAIQHGSHALMPTPDSLMFSVTSPLQGRVLVEDSLHTPRLGASPSAMFGGIEQLLRESHDWAYRDQAQFKAGFGNWADSGAEWPRQSVQEESKTVGGSSSVPDNSENDGLGSAAHNRPAALWHEMRHSAGLATAALGASIPAAQHPMVATAAQQGPISGDARRNQFSQLSAEWMTVAELDAMTSTDMYTSMNYNEQEWYQ